MNAYGSAELRLLWPVNGSSTEGFPTVCAWYGGPLSEAVSGKDVQDFSGLLEVGQERERPRLSELGMPDATFSALQPRPCT